MDKTAVAGKNVHVTYSHADKIWNVKYAGEDKAIATFSTQEEAFEHGRDVAKQQKSELLLHGKDGAIREKNSYGNDPRGVKG